MVKNMLRGRWRDAGILICTVLVMMDPISVICQTCPAPVLGNTNSQAPRFLEISVPSDNVCKLFKLYFVAYVLGIDSPEFCTMATSALSFGFELNLIGLERASRDKEASSIEMFWALQDFAKSLPDESTTIILFVGSANTLFTASPESLLLGFLQTEKDVIFSATKDCCHEWWSSVESLRRQQPLRCDDRCVCVCLCSRRYSGSGAVSNWRPRKPNLLKRLARPRHAHQEPPIPPHASLPASLRSPHCPSTLHASGGGGGA